MVQSALCILGYGGLTLYILFKCTWNGYKINYILGYKTSLNKFKRIQLIQSMFADHNGIQLEIKKRKISGKSPKYLKTK